MAKKFGEIELVGLKQFQRAARKSTDTELPKRLGEAHRHIGQMVIDRLSPRPDPAAVGQGRGAAVRPSATKREVLLRAGGAHRAGRPHAMRWGKERGPNPFTRRPARPHIKGTVDKHRKQIEKEYLKAVTAAMDGAFAETDP